MKKTIISFVSLLLLSALTLCCFASCGNETAQGETSNKLRISTLIGPTGMGMAKLIEDDANGVTQTDYEFKLCTSPDQITPDIMRGDFDVAALPVNLASTLYNKTGGKIELAGINTLGVLYILERGNTVNGISDLKGKTLYITGQNAMPEYVLRYILQKNGIENDVKIEYVAEHAELATKVTAGQVDLCMLPEPNVSSVLMSNNDVRIALDINSEWEKVETSKLIQGCIVINKEFAQKNGELVDRFLADYKASVDFALNNTDEAALLIEKAGIIPKAALAKKALPSCNICLITGDEMKEYAGDVLKVLYDFAPASIGGSIPDENFFRK